MEFSWRGFFLLLPRLLTPDQNITSLIISGENVILRQIQLFSLILFLCTMRLSFFLFQLETMKQSIRYKHTYAPIWTTLIHSSAGKMTASCFGIKNHYFYWLSSKVPQYEWRVIYQFVEAVRRVYPKEKLRKWISSVRTMPQLSSLWFQWPALRYWGFDLVDHCSFFTWSSPLYHVIHKIKKKN